MSADAIDGGFDDDVDVDDEVAPEGNRIVGARARTVAERVARSLAGDADAIEVELTELGPDEVSILIHANPDDLGRLIGRRGRVIQAIRQVTRAAAASEGVRAEVDLAD